MLPGAGSAVNIDQVDTLPLDLDCLEPLPAPHPDSLELQDAQPLDPELVPMQDSQVDQVETAMAAMTVGETKGDDPKVPALVPASQELPALDVTVSTDKDGGHGAGVETTPPAGGTAIATPPAPARESRQVGV